MTTKYAKIAKRLRVFGELLSGEDRITLRKMHDDYGFACSAHSEGQSCCVDHILGDVRDTDE